MKKLILAAAVAGAVLLSSAAQAQTTPEGYQLQQVLMMSRHNLRAPLANNGSVLEQSTPNQWPEWDVPAGSSPRKAVCWKFIWATTCENGWRSWGWSRQANARRRTRYIPMPTVCNAPLRRHNSLSPALSLGATFRYIIRKKMGTMDPTFNPVITDDSAAFSQKAVQAMEKSAARCSLTTAISCWRR